MAWTSKSERWGGGFQNTPETVGPGIYVSHNQYGADHSYAPFGSTKERLDKGGSEVKASQVGPPPGAYDPKLPGSYDSGLPRKEIPFQSSADRSTIPKASKMPGPGEYDVRKKLGGLRQASRTMGEPIQERKSVFRSSSAPSIPQKHQACGYEETGDGRLVRQGPRDLSLTGRPDDSAGPGHYEMPLQRRPVGGKMLGYRGPGMKGLETPGPGHYIARKSSEGRAVSSSFVSQADRSSLPASKLKQFGELPGPGAYTHENRGPGNLREKHAELQYFNSTTERFGSLGDSKNPGPGSYAEPVRHLRIQPKPFGSSSRKISESRRSLAPGPGEYDPYELDGKTSGPTGTVSILGAMGGLAFGSMSKKGAGGACDTKAGDLPGPGAYEWVDPHTTVDFGSKGGERPLQARRRGLPSSVFASGTARDQVVQDAIKISNSQPAPGAYDPVLAQDTTAVVRMPQSHEGFLGAAPRFTYADRSKSMPGPGGYDPRETTGGKVLGTFNRTVIEDGPRQGIAKGLGFATQTQRFPGVSMNPSKTSPGPGSYSADPGWISKTHNIYFGDLA